MLLYFLKVRHLVMITVKIKSRAWVGVGGRNLVLQGGQWQVRMCQHWRGYVYIATENSTFWGKIISTTTRRHLYLHKVMHFIPYTLLLHARLLFMTVALVFLSYIFETGIHVYKLILDRSTYWCNNMQLKSIY